MVGGWGNRLFKKLAEQTKKQRDKIFPVSLISLLAIIVTGCAFAVLFLGMHILLSIAHNIKTC